MFEKEIRRNGWSSYLTRQFAGDAVLDSRPPVNLDAIKKILRLPFRYLDQGSKAVAFQSADNAYVLKLFKTPSAIKAQFDDWGMPLHTMEDAIYDGPSEKASEKIFEANIQSCKLAFRRLKALTGLIYVHLDRTNYLSEKLNLPRLSLPADETPFLIQKKAELVLDRITTLMSQNNLEQAKRVLDQFLTLVIQLWGKGISDDTFNFHNNYGFDDRSRLIMIDAGDLYDGATFVMEQIISNAILKGESYYWLKTDYPVLARYLKRETEKRSRAFLRAT